MSEFLTQLLQAVIIAAITVCASFLIRFLNQKSGQIAAETDSVELKNLLEQVAELHEVPEGAYNIRANGKAAARQLLTPARPSLMP